MQMYSHIIQAQFGLTEERYPIRSNVYHVLINEDYERNRGAGTSRLAGASGGLPLECDSESSDSDESRNEDSGVNNPVDSDGNGSGSASKDGNGGTGGNKDGNAGSDSANDGNGGSDNTDHNNGSNSDNNCGNNGDGGSDPGDGNGSDKDNRTDDTTVDETMEEDDEEGPKTDNPDANTDSDGNQPPEEPETMDWQDSSDAFMASVLAKPIFEVDKEMALVLAFGESRETRPVSLSDVKAFFETAEAKEQLAKPILPTPAGNATVKDNNNDMKDNAQKDEDMNKKKDKGKRTAKLPIKNPKPDSTSGPPEVGSPESGEGIVSEPELMISLELRRVTPHSIHRMTAPSGDGNAEPAVMDPATMWQRLSENAAEGEPTTTQPDPQDFWDIPEKELTPQLAARLRIFPNPQVMKRQRPPAPRPYPEPSRLHETSADRLRRICKRDRVLSLDAYDQEQGPSGLCVGSQDASQRYTEPPGSGTDQPGPSGAPPPLENYTPSVTCQTESSVVGMDLSNKNKKSPSNSRLFETDDLVEKTSSI